MITPEMYRNVMDRIAWLERELRQCKDIGNNLIIENTKLLAELERLQGRRA
jgi:hypothetical protein